MVCHGLLQDRDVLTGHQVEHSIVTNGSMLCLTLGVDLWLLLLCGAGSSKARCRTVKGAMSGVPSTASCWWKQPSLSALSVTQP
jgi:hypothetical protein